MFMLLRPTVALLAACCLAISLPAHNPPASPAPAGLLIADGGRGGVLEILRHDVRVTINNGVAVTRIDQVFKNTEGRVVEALYTFPVPKNASVANFSMWIRGKEMVGEVVEKKRAREVYDSYKRRGKDPGLLEQVNYKEFEMRIFPIAPDAEQRVRVEYYQELDVDGDWCTYVYPLATTTRPGLDARVKGRFSLTLEAKSKVPIVGMTSPSHKDDFVVARHGQDYREASLELTDADLRRDVVIAWQLQRSKTGLDFIASKQRREDGFLQITLTTGEDLERLDTGMDYVFVSDVSGSMANDGKLVVSQKSVRAFIDALGDKDRFEMISFNVASETLFGKLTAVTTDAQAQAGQFLASQRARGGTRLHPALEAAFRYADSDRPLNVVILSDGMTEESEHRRLLALIQGRPKGVRTFCIGVGNDVDRPLLRQVARSTGGLAAFISRGDDFDRQAKAFRRKLTRPAIADVEVLVNGVRVYDVEPRKLPNLYHGSPVRIYSRYKSGGKAKVVLRGTVQGAPFLKTYDVELPKAAADNPEIERMWAWHRVQSLLNEERREGKKGRHVPAIVELCEGFSIPSEYASFLVLENDAEYRRWKIERRNATRLKRDRAAQQRLRKRLDQIRDRSEAQLGPQAEPAPLNNQVAKPKVGPQTSPPGQAPRTPTRQAPPDQDFGDTQPRRRRSKGRSGGGAVDPLTGSLALGLVIVAACRRRRRSGAEARARG